MKGYQWLCTGCARNCAAPTARTFNKKHRYWQRFTKIQGLHSKQRRVSLARRGHQYNTEHTLALKCCRARGKIQESHIIVVFRMERDEEFPERPALKVAWSNACGTLCVSSTSFSMRYIRTQDSASAGLPFLLSQTSQKHVVMRSDQKTLNE